MAALTRGLGSVLRGLGKALEGLGSGVQGSLAYKETRECSSQPAKRCNRAQPPCRLPLGH